jgi:DNA-binding LacI/PurR family transcriptional regulator
MASSPGTHRARRTPALSKALAYLAAAEFQGESIDRLAADADVSYLTMWKALRVQGRGSGRASAGKPPLAGDTARYKWQEVQDRIEKDLLHGVLPRHGLLPQIKELCPRYNAGFRAIRQALESLCASGRLQREVRRYRCPVRRTASPLKVFVVVHHGGTGPLEFYTDYDLEFIPALEAECSRRNLSMEILRFSAAGSRIVIHDVSGKHEVSPEAGPDTAGYVLISDGTFGAQVDDLLTRLHASRKPVVFVDEVGGSDLPGFLAHSGRALALAVRPYMTASRMLGKMLAEMGHRRLAYFSLAFQDPWSKECLQTLTQTMNDAGDNGAVTPFVWEYSWVTWECIADAHARFSKIPVRELYERKKKSLPPSYIQQLDHLFSRVLDTHLAYAEGRYRLEPLMKQALADKSITCWVASDSDTVWYAGDFLNKTRADVSLVGFGKSLEITKRRISTWDFNALAAAATTVEYLLHPEQKLPGQTDHTFAIQGTLIDRGSLKRAL